MAKRKGEKGQTTIYKTLHKKTEDRVTRSPQKTRGELRCCGRVAPSSYKSGEQSLIMLILGAAVFRLSI